MNRFWIILAVVVVALGAIFVATKPKTEDAGRFSGDASQLQADDHVRNSRELKVSLIEYGDFQCPSCASFYPIVRQLKETYNEQVSFVFRHFPLISMHPNAFAASRAAEAAGNQGKFWEMHDKLFETQSSWGQVSVNQQSLFEQYAQELGLDMEKFKTDYASVATANRINRDVSSAKSFDITGTPSFILNGQKIQNPNTIDEFKSIIDEAIKKAGGTPPKTEASQQ